jgi:hypothetical protein
MYWGIRKLTASLAVDGNMFHVCRLGNRETAVSIPDRVHIVVAPIILIIQYLYLFLTEPINSHFFNVVGWIFGTSVHFVACISTMFPYPMNLQEFIRYISPFGPQSLPFVLPTSSTEYNV